MGPHACHGFQHRFPPVWMRLITAGGYLFSKHLSCKQTREADPKLAGEDTLYIRGLVRSKASSLMKLSLGPT